MNTGRFLSILVALALTGGVYAEPGLSELTERADSGDLGAALALGMRYRDGVGVERDLKVAVRWYRVCADGGDGAGMDNVGYMYLRGMGVPEDWALAAAYFKAAAKAGNAQGMFNLGNSYFSGQGVEQDYARAIEAWERAAGMGHVNSIWRLATLYAAGEGVVQDREKAKDLCEKIAGDGHVDAMLLLGELCALGGDSTAASEWWEKAAGRGSKGARAMIELAKWRSEEPVAGELSYVEVDHLYQGWNNCGATSIGMFARHSGCATDPYAVKRLCPRSPIGTGTDWADLVAAGEELGQRWEMVTFANDDGGFEKGAGAIRGYLDAQQPVVIDFTVKVERDGKVERFGHTLLVVGYHAERDEFVLKNPNQPPPGIELMSAEELKANWYSRGYSRLARGKVARPLIVQRK